LRANRSARCRSALGERWSGMGGSIALGVRAP
jgi:hypothetical protein